MSDPRPSDDPREPPLADRLEMLLDGQLGDAERGEVEEAVSRDAAARAAVKQQAEIDASLKRAYQPPVVDRAAWLDLAIAVEEEKEGPAGTPGWVEPPPADPKELPAPTALSDNQRTLLLALAASIACVAVWGAQWERMMALFGADGVPPITVAQVYRDTVDSGFEPRWFCDDEQLFAQTFADRQGQGLLLKPLPSGVRMAGLAYPYDFADQATSMLAYVDDRPVLVLATRADRFKPSQLEIDPGSDVAVFTRQIGDVTLIEVTPLGEPRLLSAFYAADVPESPTGRVPGQRRSGA